MSSEESPSIRKRSRSSGYPPKPPVANTQSVSAIYATPHKSKNTGSPSSSVSSGSSSIPSLVINNNNNNNGSSSPRTVTSSPGMNATQVTSVIHTPLKMLYLTAERERAEECWINRTDVRLKEIEIKGFSLFAVEDWLFEKDKPWVAQVLTGSPSNVVRMYRVGINDILPQYKHILNGAITVDHPEITSHVVKKYFFLLILFYFIFNLIYFYIFID